MTAARRCLVMALLALSTSFSEQAETAEALSSSAYLEIGPLVGHVSSTNAKVWIKASGPATASVLIGQKEDLSDAVPMKAGKLEAATFFSAHLILPDLRPEHRYSYSVLLDDRPALTRPFPSFTTAPLEGSKGRVRFAFVSCVGYNGFDSAATWADMATRTNFHLLLMLGDNHYGDTTEPAKHLEFYAVQRKLAGYAELSRRIPQYAIWDNHDYGPNPTDKRLRNKEQTLEAFKMFWPNPAYGEADNAGVYFKFTRGDVDFFMTDDRYHRDPNNAPEDGKKSYLGAKQLDWLKRELLASKAKIKVIGSGGEFQTHGVAASWASFPRERNDLFQFIEDRQITGVLLLSGDRHFTAAYQVAGKFLEVTSGPVGSRNSASRPTAEMFYAAPQQGKFYCIYDLDTLSEPPAVTLEIYRTGEGSIFRRKFTWDEVLGVAKIKPLVTAAAPAAGR